MNSKSTEIAREGWRLGVKGDFETIEEILDRNVEWHATEPWEWDCHGRDDVMQTLRERYEQGFAKGNLQFLEGGEHAVIVVAHPSEIGGADSPCRGTATVMQFRNERVVSMQDYRTEAEAHCGCRAEVARTRRAADAVACAIGCSRCFASSAMSPVAATGSRNRRRTRAFASRGGRRPAFPPRALL